MQISVQHPKPAIIFLYDYAPSILSEKIQGFIVDINFERRNKGLEEIKMSKYEKLEESEYADLPADEQLVLQKLNRVRILNMVDKIVLKSEEADTTLRDEERFSEFLEKISKEDFQILTEKSIIKVDEENKKIEKKTSQTPTE